MSFDEVLDQVRELLRTKERVSYRALKLRFQLDDELIAGIREELVEAERVALDENGKVLVWADSDSLAAPSPYATLSAIPSSVPSEPTPPDGERRQLTVMFCDLVGSTALSEKLDPEELHHMIRTYQHTCAAIITRYESHIAQYLGDGLLVYFGYPAAHEDDARRAVQSGLEILDQLPGLQLAHPLQARIGIHTGHVVVGEVGGGEKTEHLALGDTPNIAARVQGKAEPNTVAISAATYRLVQGFFICQDLGSQHLKGLSYPLTLYHVQGEGDAQNRFDVSLQKGLTPLVGREEETELLQRRWERAKAGAGQVVLLSGEAGIGKSRLVQVLRERSADEAQFSVVWRCSPFYQNSALYPVIDRFQRLCQFTPEDSADAKLQKLTAFLTPTGIDNQETIALFATLFSLPLPDDRPAILLNPHKLKEKTLQALVTWLQQTAAAQPVCLEIEDLHWADPSTLELLGLIIDHAPTLRLLVLLTFRPEFTPPWPAQAHMLSLQLSRMTQHDIHTMVEQVAGKQLPPELLGQLVTSTDGVPLYIEEMTKNLLESGLLTETDGHYAVIGTLPPLAIPASLQDSFASRLDRLAPVRELAQIGAVLGREFSYGLLQAVSQIDERTLQEGLSQLETAEILYRRGVPPDATYFFKHALLQEAAYQSILKSKRQRWHMQTAQRLETSFPEILAVHPELVGHHFTEASLHEQAIPYWQHAGERAAQRSAYTEARRHLTTGLHCLKALPETPERDAQELSLLVTLGVPLVATQGYGVPEVEQLYSRARALCEQMGETPQLLPVLHGLRVFYLIRGELKTALALSLRILRLADRDQAFLQVAHGVVAETHFYLANGKEAEQHLSAGTRLYVPEQHRSGGFLWLDTGVACLMYDAIAKWWRGFSDQALRQCADGMRLAHALDHENTLAFALCLATWLHALRRDIPACQAAATEAIALATEHGLPNWLYYATIFRGWTLAMEGHAEEGMRQMKEGLNGWHAIGAALMQPFLLSLLADGFRVIDDAKTGIKHLSDALTLVDNHQERFVEAELYRMKGALLLQVKNDAASVMMTEESFKKALSICQEQDARAFALRAAMSLARLWQQQDKTEAASALLLPIFQWFSEGFDTTDLHDAKALLHTLERSSSPAW